MSEIENLSQEPKNNYIQNGGSSFARVANAANVVKNNAKIVADKTKKGALTASIEAKNKAKYLANLVLNTSNINKLHLKNQFYVEYMDIITINRVYSLDRQEKITADIDTANIVVPREDIVLHQGNMPGDNNFYLYGSSGETASEDSNVESGIKESEEQEKEALKFESKQLSLMPPSLKKLTLGSGYKSKIPFGRLNNAVLIDRDLYTKIETTLKEDISKSSLSTVKIELAYKLRKLYNNYVCFSKEFDYLYKYLHFYRHQLTVMFWNGTFVPFSTIDHMIEEQNEMIFKNNEIRERYVDTMKIIFKVIALMSYINPGISSKFKEVSNRLESGEDVNLMQKESEKEIDEQEDAVEEEDEGNLQHTARAEGQEQLAGNALDIITNQTVNTIQTGGGKSEILIRLRDYYDIDFELDKLDPPDFLTNKNSYLYKSLGGGILNAKAAEIKPLYSLYEAKYALLIAIMVMRQLNQPNKEAENFIRILNFERAVSSRLGFGLKYKIKFDKLNLKDENNKTVFDETEIGYSTLDTLVKKSMKIRIYNLDSNGKKLDWHEDFKKLSFSELIRVLTTYEKKNKWSFKELLKKNQGQIEKTITKQDEIKKTEEVTKAVNAQNVIDNTVPQNIGMSLQQSQVTVPHVPVDEYYKADYWINLSEEYKNNPEQLVKKLESMSTSIMPNVPLENKQPLQTKKRWFGRAGNKTQKNYQRGGNWFTEKIARSKKSVDQHNVFLKVIDSVFYTANLNMISRIVDGLSVMRDNKSMNSQTGYTMQNNLALCISKTMKYILRIPFLVCMAPISMLIGHATMGLLASPQCFMISHIFTSILLKSNILTNSFAKDISKLMGNVMFKNKYIMNNGKYESIGDTISNNMLELLKLKYTGKFCAINNSFMGILDGIRIESNDDEQTYVFEFTTVNYNNDKTKIIYSKSNIEKKEAYVTIRTENPVDEIITEVIPYVYACPNYYNKDERDLGSSIAKFGSNIKGRHIHTEATSIRELEKIYKRLSEEDKKTPQLSNQIEFQYEYDYNGAYLGYIHKITKKSILCIPSRITNCTYEAYVPNVLKSTYDVDGTEFKRIYIESSKPIHIIVPYDLPGVTDEKDKIPNHEYEELQCKTTQNRVSDNKTQTTYIVNDLIAQSHTPEKLLEIRTKENDENAKLEEEKNFANEQTTAAINDANETLKRDLITLEKVELDTLVKDEKEYFYIKESRINLTNDNGKYFAPGESLVPLGKFSNKETKEDFTMYIFEKGLINSNNLRDVFLKSQN
jgi:hypothetical protein